MLVATVYIVRLQLLGSNLPILKHTVVHNLSFRQTSWLYMITLFKLLPCRLKLVGLK